MEICSEGTRIVLAGDFDVRSTWEVRAAIYEHLEGLDHDVVVDLTDVGSIDLTALRLLAVASRVAERGGHHLVLRGCRPAVRRLLLLSHLVRHVTIERELGRGLHHDAATA